MDYYQVHLQVLFNEFKVIGAKPWTELIVSNKSITWFPWMIDTEFATRSLEFDSVTLDI